MGMGKAYLLLQMWIGCLRDGICLCLLHASGMDSKLMLLLLLSILTFLVHQAGFPNKPCLLNIYFCSISMKYLLPFSLCILLRHHVFTSNYQHPPCPQLPDTGDKTLFVPLSQTCYFFPPLSWFLYLKSSGTLCDSHSPVNFGISQFHSFNIWSSTAVHFYWFLKHGSSTTHVELFQI